MTLPAGIYLHIPFCTTRCHYCNFATGGYEAELAERYVAAICAEIELGEYGGEDGLGTVDTIYLGGGTPTTLSVGQLGRILDRCRARFDILPGSEITIEANPGSIDLVYLRALRGIGIDRISFGVQSFDDRELQMIGRSHNGDEARRAVEAARMAGFTNISLDLIAGLPEQRMETWVGNLEEIFAIEPEHLSVYLLELYRDAPLQHRIERGELRPIEDEKTVEFYYRLLDEAERRGYSQYEISNWSRPGQESRHNLKYWIGAPYLAFGISAAGYDGRRRWSNTRNIHDYLARIERGESPVSELVELSDEERQSEAIFLALRLRDGVDLRAHEERFGVAIVERYKDEIERLRDAGLIEIKGGSMRISRAGKVLANEVFSAFI